MHVRPISGTGSGRITHSLAGKFCTERLGTSFAQGASIDCPFPRGLSRISIILIQERQHSKRNTTQHEQSFFYWFMFWLLQSKDESSADVQRYTTSQLLPCPCATNVNGRGQFLFAFFNPWVSNDKRRSGSSGSTWTTT